MNGRAGGGRRLGAIVIAAGALFGARCSPSRPERTDVSANRPAVLLEPKSHQASAASTSSAASPDPTSASAGSVSGVAPPRTDEVPAVVILEPSQTAADAPPAAPAGRPLMDQIATRFTPAAMVVRTGQPADFRNDDDKMHNVRVRERGHAADDLVFNVALSQGVTFDYTFRKDAAWDVRCDVHQNMYGLVVSTSSPYTAVAAEDGSFAIEGLPPGDYTAVAYTSRERREQRVHLDPGQHLELTRW